MEQGALEARSQNRSIVEASEYVQPAPRGKGVYFLSTSTIAEEDSPVILPWRVDSNLSNGKRRTSTNECEAALIPCDDPLWHVDKDCNETQEHSSQDISSFAKSIYDDSSLCGLSFMLDSEGESYEIDDNSYEILPAGLPEVSLNDDSPSHWAEPVGSIWKNEVATAMNAFRSCRVDHDDIVTFRDRDEIEVAQSFVGGSKETDRLEEIKNWRNDFIATDEINTSSSAADSITFCFRFP
ncbi:hypothetical protein JR316_0012459 [Psilocybe cubensis]|uniref:Uncharacterized protein n=2 Tax=Psilocybe cubensis TaxID=181762 RepID=A0ACB8GIH1_PSICU|nr:hypothetical protein JR316_0012459 [Psilocybe cubensis]KAH9475348.1 hypothetical protein JR316_0012459 [Psilocybe cubensis]